MNIAFLIVLVFFYVPEFWGPDGRHGWTKDHRDRHHEKTKRSEKDPGWFLYKHKIGVSDTQWANLRPDMEEFHQQALKLCRQIKTLRNEILQLIKEPESHDETIQENKQEIMALKQQKQKMFIDYMTRKKRYLNRKQERRFFGMLQKGQDCDKHTRFLEHPDDKK